VIERYGPFSEVQNPVISWSNRLLNGKPRSIGTHPVEGLEDAGCSSVRRLACMGDADCIDRSVRGPSRRMTCAIGEGERTEQDRARWDGSVGSEPVFVEAGPVVAIVARDVLGFGEMESMQREWIESCVPGDIG
jgi:hypothetical protein